MKSYILKYSAIVLAGLLIQWWIFYFAPFSIPEYIPLTPIRIDGLVLVSYIVVVLIFFQRGLLKTHPDKSIFSLTCLGAFMFFLAEIIFQGIRMPTLTAESVNERLHFFLYGVLGITIFAGVFSFLVVFQLKKKNTGLLVLLIVGLLYAFYLLWAFFPALEKT
jgi:hypothetical protein